jgi:uncharacterized radical SAM superfamily Fe-S cluster-containing enzyme
MSRSSDRTAVWPPREAPPAPSAASTVDFDVSPHVSRFLDTDDPAALRALAGDLSPDGADVLKLAASICPDCLAAGDHGRMTVPMAVFETDGEIRVRKRCPHHGTQSDVQWRNAATYRRARELDTASRHPNLRPDEADGDRDALDAAGIGNVTVTNRCDRSCHYCFFYAESGEPLHEPTKAEIESMCATLGAHDGIGAIQLTGGEPTVRADLPEIVSIAADHAEEVLLNSHGARFLHDPDLAREVSEAGARGLYTSFDGVDPERNPKNYWEFPHALSACHDTGMCAMLVPTVVDGWNDHQLGDIVRFAAANADTVCGVNFQPVSFIGRAAGDPAAEGRITISDVIERVEAQTDGAIGREAWFPLPMLRAISEFKRHWTGDHLYGVTSGFSSWMVTAVAVDDDELFPLTDLVDVEQLVCELVGLVDEFGVDPGRMDKLRVGTRLLRNFDALLGPDPGDMRDRLRKLAVESVRTRRFDGIGELFDNTLPLGVRHFQDPYNYDLDHLADSDVQYATPEGDVVPFSVYNVVPELYRDRTKAAHSVTVEEWLDRDYASLDSAADPDRSRRSADVIDPDDHENRGVFGADLTYRREYDEDRRETVLEAYRRSIEDLDPVWSVIGEVVEGTDTGAGGCCGRGSGGGTDCC